MALVIQPVHLQGDIEAIPSKSVFQRGVLCAAMAQGKSCIAPVPQSEDAFAALRAVEQAGLAQVHVEGDAAYITGGGAPMDAHVDCGESATVLRLLLPLLLRGQRVVFTGRGNLLKRPMAPYRDVVEACGGLFLQDDDALVVQAILQPGDYALPGDISSQFFSGMMLMLPTLPGQSRLLPQTALQSLPYVYLTKHVQACFRVQSRIMGDTRICLGGGQAYHAARVVTPGDWSYAAFWMVAGIVGHGVRIHGLSQSWEQADSALMDIAKRMGGHVSFVHDVLHATQGTQLCAVEADVSQCPDVAPALAVLACAARGRTSIIGAGRLRYKESDRLRALADALQSLGACIEKTPDKLLIDGRGSLRGGHANCHDDHRIAMALAVAAGICEQPVVLHGWQCIRKSAPGFFEDYEQLGGSIYER